ncbi:MAG: SlyX family protein [Kofleriaceae bacterium]|nr:SlyX family protein [Kofleriaceae bacterium]
MAATTTGELVERMMDLEVRLAFQDQLLRELDDVLRVLMDRLATAETTIEQLRSTDKSPPTALGPINEPPPHY